MKEVIDAESYILGFPEPVQSLLFELRNCIKKTAPQAEEVISYQMPAYKYQGMLVYFAGYSNHIGFYPGASGVEHFLPELTQYKTSKGTIQFPLDKPLPLDLIKRIVEFRLQENSNKKALKIKKAKSKNSN